MDVMYPQYQFTPKDAEEQLARFVHLGNPDTYPFDEFHAHEYCELLVFLEGGGKHNINFTEYDIQNRSFHILAAGDVHWVKRGMQSNGFALVFKKEFLLRLKEMNPQLNFFDFYKHSQVINLTKDDYHAFAFILSELLSGDNTPAYHLNIIGAFLTKIVEQFYVKDDRPQISGREIVVQLIGLINRHYAEHWSAAAYAEKVGCSPSTLERKVKTATGQTIAQLQQEKQLNEAKRLLYQPDSCAKEIAYELGFNNESYFSHWFKKLTGLPPLKFKEGLVPFFWLLFSLLQDTPQLLLS